MPPTLLTLPAELRDLIWEYSLVSPTGRVLAVTYEADLTFHRPSRSPAPTPPTHCITKRAPTFTKAGKKTSDPSSRHASKSKLHLVPCASKTSTPLSPTSLPLARHLPLVSRQVHTETATRLWMHNTLVLPDHISARAILKHFGQKPSRAIQRIEMCIGAVGTHPQVPQHARKTLRMLASRVYGGALTGVRLRFLEEAWCGDEAWGFWMEVLGEDARTCSWKGCEREVVCAVGMGTEGELLRLALARRWGLERGLEERGIFVGRSTQEVDDGD